MKTAKSSGGLESVKSPTLPVTAARASTVARPGQAQAEPD